MSHKTLQQLLESDSIRLSRDDSGKLCMSVADDSFDDVTVRRAFPFDRPFQFISFYNSDGEEIGMIGDCEDLESVSKEILQDALLRTYFLPLIQSIEHIGEEFGVINADVVTSSGPRQIEIRGFHRNIRPLSKNPAIIEDVEGNRYELRNWKQLPKLTREILGL